MESGTEANCGGNDFFNGLLEQSDALAVLLSFPPLKGDVIASTKDGKSVAACKRRNRQYDSRLGVHLAASFQIELLGGTVCRAPGHSGIGGK